MPIVKTGFKKSSSIKSGQPFLSTCSNYSVSMLDAFMSYKGESESVALQAKGVLNILPAHMQQ
jgi:hypothetical protein